MTPSFYSRANEIGTSAPSSHDSYRAACNYAKSLVIDGIVRGDRASVLDLACGRGGDLAKFKESARANGTRLEYLGLDSAEGALAEADARRRGNSAYRFSLGSFVDPVPGRFSATWCAFAAHYAAQTRADLDGFANNLAAGGIAAAVITNGFEIAKRIVRGRRSGTLWSLEPNDPVSRGRIMGRTWSEDPHGIMIRFGIGGFTPGVEPLMMEPALTAAMASRGKVRTSRVRLDLYVRDAIRRGAELGRLDKMLKGAPRPGPDEFDALALYQIVTYE